MHLNKKSISSLIKSENFLRSSFAFFKRKGVEGRKNITLLIFNLQRIYLKYLTFYVCLFSKNGIAGTLSLGVVTRKTQIIKKVMKFI